MAEPLTREDVDHALGGDEGAVRRLVGALTPVIQARVARVLLRRRTGAAASRDVRQEVEDLAQEVFLTLFADEGEVLRAWEPERGLSLANYAGLVAERRAASILRSGRRSPWKEDPTLGEDLDSPTPDPDPETAAVSRQALAHLLERLDEELSPLGRHLFSLLFLRELPVEEVTAATAMSPDAVYAWRSRLRRLVKKLHAELSETVAPERRPWVEGRRS